MFQTGMVLHPAGKRLYMLDKEESRKLKPTTINKFTFIDEGKRWLKKVDAIRFFVGYHKDRDRALVEIVDATYDFEDQIITYYLGKIYEVILKDNQLSS
jgi:hypothetical protein